MPFAQSQGARIYWRWRGLSSLPPLVLLHTIGTDMGIFERSAPFLERHFRLLMIDNRGHGASDAPEAEYSLSLLAGDVAAVMDAVGVESAVICGVSIGAMVAMQMALDMPERVRGLVLANTSAQMDPALWPKRIGEVRAGGVAAIAEGWVQRHFSEAFIRDNPVITESVYANMAAMGRLGYVGCAAAIRDMDVLDGLPGIAVPCTVIAGELDGPTPFQGHGDRIAAAIPGATVEFLPAGHLACIEQPEAFALCVEALAARCG